MTRNTKHKIRSGKKSSNLSFNIFRNLINTNHENSDIEPKRVFRVKSSLT